MAVRSNIASQHFYMIGNVSELRDAGITAEYEDLFFASIQKFTDNFRSDKPGAAGDKYGHLCFLFHHWAELFGEVSWDFI